MRRRRPLDGEHYCCRCKKMVKARDGKGVYFCFEDIYINPSPVLNFSCNFSRHISLKFSNLFSLVGLGCSLLDVSATETFQIDNIRCARSLSCPRNCLLYGFKELIWNSTQSSEEMSIRLALMELLYSLAFYS
jgi:hypothetical protein